MLACRTCVTFCRARCFPFVSSAHWCWRNHYYALFHELISVRSQSRLAVALAVAFKSSSIQATYGTPYGKTSAGQQYLHVDLKNLWMDCIHSHMMSTFCQTIFTSILTSQISFPRSIFLLKKMHAYWGKKVYFIQGICMMRYIANRVA